MIGTIRQVSTGWTKGGRRLCLNPWPEAPLGQHVWSMMPNHTETLALPSLSASCPRFYSRTDPSTHASHASSHQGQVVKPPVATDFSASLPLMELYKPVQHCRAHYETSGVVHCPSQPQDLSLSPSFHKVWSTMCCMVLFIVKSVTNTNLLVGEFCEVSCFSYSLGDISEKLLVLLIKVVSWSEMEYIIWVFELLCFQSLKLYMASLKHFRFWCLICPDFVSSGMPAILHKCSKDWRFRLEIFSYNLLRESLISLLSSLQFISNGIWKKIFLNS